MLPVTLERPIPRRLNWLVKDLAREKELCDATEARRHTILLLRNELLAAKVHKEPPRSPNLFPHVRTQRAGTITST